MVQKSIAIVNGDDDESFEEEQKASQPEGENLGGLGGEINEL